MHFSIISVLSLAISIHAHGWIQDPLVGNRKALLYGTPSDNSRGFPVLAEQPLGSTSLIKGISK